MKLVYSWKEYFGQSTQTLYEVGDLMILEDHICLIPNPLIGVNLDELGPRFPDMSEPYDHNMIKIAEQIASDNNLPITGKNESAISSDTNNVSSALQTLGF